MKLFAIRHKETKTWLGAEHGSLVFNENKGGFFGEDEMQEWRDLPLIADGENEIVTLREEPSEPCWHCKGINRQDPDNVWRDKFCRKCGRSLE